MVACLPATAAAQRPQGDREFIASESWVTGGAVLAPLGLLGRTAGHEVRVQPSVALLLAAESLPRWSTIPLRTTLLVAPVRIASDARAGCAVACEDESVTGALAVASVGARLDLWRNPAGPPWLYLLAGAGARLQWTPKEACPADAACGLPAYTGGSADVAGHAGIGTSFPVYGRAWSVELSDALSSFRGRAPFAGASRVQHDLTFAVAVRLP